MTDIISTKTKITKKSVSFRVNESTADKLNQLKKRVKGAGSDIEFRLDDVVDEQLTKLIDRANKQLDSLDISA